MRAARRAKLGAVGVICAMLCAGGGGGAAEGKPGAPLPPPHVWANLHWSPAVPVTSLGPGSTGGALAVSEKQLLLAEIHAGGVYLSELDPRTAAAVWTAPVAAAVVGRERSRVQVAIQREQARVAWLEGSPGGAAAVMVATVMLENRASQPPAELATTTALAGATHNQQLWLAWLAGEANGSIILSGGTVESPFLVPWKPPTPGPPVEVAVCDLGADLCVPFLAREGTQASLWLAQYSGRRFYGLRKLHGTGPLSGPAACLLQTRILLLCTKTAASGAGDLALTITNPLGTELVTDLYLADGKRNLNPSLVARDKTAYVVYNSWQGETNLGLFLGKIESDI